MKHNKKSTKKNIKKSIESLQREMQVDMEMQRALSNMPSSNMPSSMGEGEEYYQLEALRSAAMGSGSYMNEDLERIKSCMQKMMVIISSLDHCNTLTEQRYVSVMQEIAELKIKIARLEGHDNVFH